MPDDSDHEDAHEPEINPTPQPGELTIESQILYERLRAVPVGDTISYAELSKAVDRDVQNEGRHNLRYARDRLLEKEGRVTMCVRNEGVKICTGRDSVFVARHHTRKATSQARRSLDVSETVDLAELPEPEKRTHIANVAISGTMALVGSGKTYKATEQLAESKAGEVGRKSVLDYVRRLTAKLPEGEKE